MMATEHTEHTEDLASPPSRLAGFGPASILCAFCVFCGYFFRPFCGFRSFRRVLWLVWLVLSSFRGDMVPLTVLVKRGRNGKDVLVIERDDGTSTWQHVTAGMPLHDLVHLAVESTLALAEGFYGLVAAGWDIEDFTRDGATARLPPVSIWVEIVVFMLQLERANGHRLSASEFTAAVDQSAEQKQLSFRRAITDQELASVREMLGRLLNTWQTLLPGDAMVCTIVPGAADSLELTPTT